MLDFCADMFFSASKLRTTSSAGGLAFYKHLKLTIYVSFCNSPFLHKTASPFILPQHLFTIQLTSPQRSPPHSKQFYPFLGMAVVQRFYWICLLWNMYGYISLFFQPAFKGGQLFEFLVFFLGHRADYFKKETFRY